MLLRNHIFITRKISIETFRSQVDNFPFEGKLFQIRCLKFNLYIRKHLKIIFK